MINCLFSKFMGAVRGLFLCITYIDLFVEVMPGEVFIDFSIGACFELTSYAGQAG